MADFDLEDQRTIKVVTPKPPVFKVTTPPVQPSKILVPVGGPPGPPGEEGDQGPIGNPGARGNRIFTALDDPGDIAAAIDGDWYYDGAGNVYVFQDGDPVFIGSIVGPQGASVTVTVVPDADWPPPADANPLHLYFRAAP